MTAKKKVVKKKANIKCTETTKSVIEYKRGRGWGNQSWEIELKQNNTVMVTADCGEETEISKELWPVLKSAIDKAFGIK